MLKKKKKDEKLCSKNTIEISTTLCELGWKNVNSKQVSKQVNVDSKQVSKQVNVDSKQVPDACNLSGGNH